MTDPNAPASTMTKREKFAMEFVAASLSNPLYLQTYSVNAQIITNDAAVWADSLIHRLNNEPPPQAPPKENPLKSVPSEN